MFEHKLRVGWGDCDPACIAYTGRLPNFALEAIDAWWGDTIGANWFQMEMDRGSGAPFVSLSMDFRSPVTPRHTLICKVAPTKISKTSVTLRVEGWQDDVLCFEGSFTEIFIVPGKLKSVRPPEEIRALISARLIPAA